MIKKLLVVLVLLFGLVLRTYKIDNPVADWHSHRQADTASVTKIYLEQGIDLLHPRYHDLSNLQSGKDNPQGYRMVEFPIYNLLSIATHKVISAVNPNISIDISSRITSIWMSLLTAVFIFLFVFKVSRNYLASLFSLSCYLLLPFSIYYSRSILPEPAANLFMSASAFLFLSNVYLASLFFALAILVKPYTALLLFPLFCYLSIQQLKKSPRLPSLISLVVFSIISLAPFIAWRFWISQFPEGIPASNWLFNGGGMRFRPAWFRWLFYERLSNLILGAYGLIPLFLGFAYKKNKSQPISVLMFLGIIIYFSIIAQGNIQHDYYQSLIIPFLSVILGFGFYYLYSYIFKSRIASILVVALIAGSSFLFSFFQVREYFKVNNSAMIKAGQTIKEIVPKDSILVAPYNGDTAFLYQTGHIGYPIEIYDWDKLKKFHPRKPIYFASTSFDTYTNSVIPKFETIQKTPEFIILKIQDGKKN